MDFVFPQLLLPGNRKSIGVRINIILSKLFFCYIVYHKNLWLTPFDLKQNLNCTEYISRSGIDHSTPRGTWPFSDQVLSRKIIRGRFNWLRY